MTNDSDLETSRSADAAWATLLTSDASKGALAGAVAAAVSLAFGTMVADLSDTIPSLVIGIGEVIVDKVPGPVAATSIETLGTAQKPALLIGIVVISILIGGALGYLSVTRSRAIAMAGFAGFGILGAWGLARNPLSPVFGSWLTALVAAGLGLATLLILIGVQSRTTAVVSTETPTNRHGNRRAFLTYAGGAGVAAVAMTSVGKVSGGASKVEEARDAIKLSPATNDSAAALIRNTKTLDRQIEGLTSYITPNNDFYRIDTAFSVPEVKVDTWSLKVKGMVDTPLEFSYQDLLDMGTEDHVVTLSCVSNPVGGTLVGNAVWTGIPLDRLLVNAGVQPGATQIVGRSVDDWSGGFPTELIHDGRTAMLAIGMNGEPLPIRSGFPARLVVAGLYGYVSATKWIKEIEFTTWESFDGYWIDKGWSKEGPIKTQSRIDVPQSFSIIPSGPTTVAGVAWAPTRGISTVEISVDGGDWTECEMGEAVGDETWLQWKTEWTAAPGDHAIQVRASDGNAVLQPVGPARPDPNGAEGYHLIQVRVD